MSYMTSNYEFTCNDKATLHRGNYRYLFNETLHNFNETKNIFESKAFPVNRYPTSVYKDILNISSSFNRSLSLFEKYQYSTALAEIISAFKLSLNILQHCSKFNTYFIPVLNLYTINESIVDYGDNIIIDGKIVSYEFPNVSIRKDNLIDYCNIETLANDSYCFEVEFISTISSVLWGSPEGEGTIIIDVFDGVTLYSYDFFLNFQTICISIVTPSTGMVLDLTYSESFPIFGHYYSISNTSTIQIIYGGYWYVNDHKDNDTFWININKENSKEWLFAANSSLFANGDNIIIVRITNGVSTREDTVTLTIHGLPESPSPNSTIPSAISTSNTKTIITHNPPPLDSVILVMLSLIIIFTSYPTFRLTKGYWEKRTLEKLSQTNYREALTPSSHLKELSEKVDSKLELRETRKKSTRKFKPKRRR